MVLTGTTILADLARPTVAHTGGYYLPFQKGPTGTATYRPSGARVERHHTRALAVVLGLGDGPLHEHASAGGQSLPAFGQSTRVHISRLPSAEGLPVVQVQVL